MEYFLIYTGICLIYVFADAWHDEQLIIIQSKTKENIKKQVSLYHKIDACIKAFMTTGLSFFMLEYFDMFTWWIFIWSIAWFSLFIRFGMFQLFLNLCQKLHWDYKGVKDPFNKFGFWGFNAVILVILTIIYFTEFV